MPTRRAPARISVAIAARLVLGLGLVLDLGVGCATNPVTGDRDFVLMTEEEEIALGHRTQQEVLQAYQPYSDPALQAHIEEVGREIAAQSHRPDLDYHFTLLDSDEVNAFALPGGYIYITRGLLVYLDSDAELAAVLGHEIGHVTARHSVRQDSAQKATSIGVTIASIFTPGYAGAAAGSLAGVFGGALLSGYGREHELEADRLGAEYLARVGYDPDAMLHVIGTLKDQEAFEIQRASDEGRQPQVYHGVFASHPSNDQRLQEVVEAARTLEVPEPRPTNREEFLARLDGMPFGESASQGTVRGRYFYHADFGIGLAFPEGWAVQNQPQSVVAIAPGKEAIVELRLHERGQHATPEEFLRWKLRVSPESHTAAYRVAGLPAYTTVSSGKTPWGRRDIRYVVIFVGKQVYVFEGAARDYDGLARYDRDFRDTAGSFHALTERERARTQVPSIRLVRVGEGTTYEGLARNVRIRHDPEPELRLLNGDYPEGEPEPGSLVKVVR
ncbi:MAG: M48 family metalloprotease [Myxococcales bacterium]|nr:M48 family metalloprotease [Myxococcales bacterium]